MNETAANDESSANTSWEINRDKNGPSTERLNTVFFPENIDI